MKITILVVFSCLIIGITPIIILSSTTFSSNDRQNGFLRTFQTDTVFLRDKIDLKFSRYYLAGFTSDYIYLGNYQTPSHLLEIDHQLIDSNHYRLNYPKDIGFVWDYAKLTIDSPFIYMNEGVTGTNLQGDLTGLNMGVSMKNGLSFTEAVPISPSTVFIKSIDEDLNRNILAKNTKNSAFLQKETDILEKQVDGIFCTDGRLSYDKKTAQLIYLYYYRNQFICMDTNLNISYRGHTIDTNNLAKINVATIGSEKSTTMSSPPLLVNDRSCTYNNLIYIQSALLADNQEPDEFYQNATIDTYSLEDGKYLYSFYIPINKGEKLQEFQIIDDTIILLSNTNFLYIYQLGLSSYLQSPDKNTDVNEIKTL